jgi:hypothetical protein
MSTAPTATTLAGALAPFQDAFARALLAPDAAPGQEVARLCAQPAFAVYRNTVLKGCIDALRANYPAVTRLVGDEWFRAAAAVYARDNLPRHPSLMLYGASFPEFLERFEPAAGLPYLPGVARLDRLWTEAHAAPDEEAVDPGAVARLAPEVLAGSVLRPHAAARWAWFPELPIYTIWSRNRGDDAFPADLDWKAEGALLVRPRDTVEWIEIDAAACEFLDICAAGGTLSDAARAALEARSDCDLAGLIAALLAAGAFSGTSPAGGNRFAENGQ